MEEENRSGNNRQRLLMRLIRVLIVIVMILIMFFLFLTARTIYMNRTAPENDIPSSAEAPVQTPETSKERESTETETEEAKENTEETAGDIFETAIEAARVTENISNGRILIGDSRFAYLKRQITLRPGDTVIAKGGEYFTWFRDKAVPELKALLDEDPNRDVIINMGLNDCANNSRGWTAHFTPDYADVINELYLSYPETAFYYASIGPTKGPYPSKHGSIKPEELQLYIDMFNYAMQTQCMAEYIDLGEFLYDGSPTYEDNVHYDRATDQQIYDYIIDHVRPSSYDAQE